MIAIARMALSSRRRRVARAAGMPEPTVNHDGHIVRANGRAADGWGTQIGRNAVSRARERRRFDTVVGAL
jgi:hypothetical protein